MRIPVVLLVFFVSCTSDSASPPAQDLQKHSPTSEELTIGCTAEAAVSPSVTHRELVKRFGSDSVRDENIYIGEGFEEPGTVLFPEDPTRRMDIFWEEKNFGKRLSRALVPWERERQTLWKGDFGITKGTTLQELEHLNGKPFLLAGMGWDYAGTVVDWGGGKFAKTSSDSCRLLVRLDAVAELSQTERDALRSVSGDSPFSSDSPGMQTLNPRVYQFGILIGAKD